MNAYKNLISNSDLYNYLSIRKIINCFENRIKKVAVLKGDLNDKLDRNYLNNHSPIKKILFNVYSSIFSFFLEKNKIFIASVFSMKNLIKLNLRI